MLYIYILAHFSIETYIYLIIYIYIWFWESHGYGNPHVYCGTVSYMGHLW